MKVIGINDVIDVNRLLADKGMPYKIHLRDACGKQSCWIEEASEEDSGARDRMRDLLIGFFSKRGITLEFDEEGMAFWVG